MELTKETRLLLAMIAKLQNHVLMTECVTNATLGELQKLTNPNFEEVLQHIEARYSAAVLKQIDYFRDIQKKIYEGEPPMNIDDFLKG